MESVVQSLVIAAVVGAALLFLGRRIRAAVRSARSPSSDCTDCGCDASSGKQTGDWAKS